MVSVLPLGEPLVDRVEYSVEVGRLPLIPHQDPLDRLGEDDAGLRSRRCGNYSNVLGKNLIDFCSHFSNQGLLSAYQDQSTPFSTQKIEFLNFQIEFLYFLS